VLDWRTGLDGLTELGFVYRLCDRLLRLLSGRLVSRSGDCGCGRCGNASAA